MKASIKKQLSKHHARLTEIKKELGLISSEISDQHNYADGDWGDMSEGWQESEKGEAEKERVENIEDAEGRIDLLISDLDEVLESLDNAIAEG